MSYILSLANNLVDLANLSPKFNMETLVEKLGGKIKYVYDPSIDAYIQKSEDSFIIVVDISKPERRQRFSIAHEIGHLLIHMNYFDEELWSDLEEIDSRIYRYGHDIQELEANQFAAELLMPAKSFKKVASNALFEGTYYLDEIADYFDVSLDAVRYRGHNLNLWNMNKTR